jgi:hypothetical protein
MPDITMRVCRIRTLKPAIMVVAIINSIFLINSSLITDCNVFVFWKCFNCLKRITNKFSEKHENLRDNCEYNTQWKLYLYLTKYLFR